MKADPDISKVDFDVNKIMSKSNQVVYINTTHPVLESLHCTIKNNKFAKCAPPSTEIASDIAICVKALQWVKSTLLYCPSAAHLLTQAILINAHRLHKMSSVETDVSIDMDDEHYKVDPSSIPDLLQVPPMKAFANISEEKDNPPNNSATQHQEIKKATKQADKGGDGDDEEEEEDNLLEEEDDSLLEEEGDSSWEEEGDAEGEGEWEEEDSSDGSWEGQAEVDLQVDALVDAQGMCKGTLKGTLKGTRKGMCQWTCKWMHKWKRRQRKRWKCRRGVP